MTEPEGSRCLLLPQQAPPGTELPPPSLCSPTDHSVGIRATLGTRSRPVIVVMEVWNGQRMRARTSAGKGQAGHDFPVTDACETGPNRSASPCPEKACPRCIPALSLGLTSSGILPAHLFFLFSPQSL